MRELQQMKSVWKSSQEVSGFFSVSESGPTFEEQYDKEASEKATTWYKQLEDGKFRVGDYLALASYFNQAPNPALQGTRDEAARP